MRARGRRPAEPALVAQGQPAAVVEVHDEAVPARRCLRPPSDAPLRLLSSIAMRPAMPRCRPRTGPSSEVSTHIAFPRRCAAVRVGGLRAHRRSRRGRAGGTHSCRHRRPRRCAAAGRRARSVGCGRAQPREARASCAVFPAGVWACAPPLRGARAAVQRGAVVVELEDLHRAVAARRRGTGGRARTRRRSRRRSRPCRRRRRRCRRGRPRRAWRRRPRRRRRRRRPRRR